MGAVDVLAGHVYAHRRRGSESASFLYDEAYLARVDAYALDPALPLMSGLQQSPANQKIFGAFADTSPDRWGRNLIQRAETRRVTHEAAVPRSFGEFDLLLRVRDDHEFDPVPYSAQAAHLYGAIAASVRKSGRNPCPRRIDLVLASVSAELNAVLLTRNPDDFAGIADIAHVIAV